MSDPDDPKSREADPPRPEEPWAGNEDRRADYLGALMAGKAHRIPAKPSVEPWEDLEERTGQYLFDLVTGKADGMSSAKPAKPKKRK